MRKDVKINRSEMDPQVADLLCGSKESITISVEEENEKEMIESFKTGVVIDGSDGFVLLKHKGVKK